MIPAIALKLWGRFRFLPAHILPQHVSVITLLNTRNKLTIMFQSMMSNSACHGRFLTDGRSDLVGFWFYKITIAEVTSQPDRSLGSTGTQDGQKNATVYRPAGLTVPKSPQGRPYSRIRNGRRDRQSRIVHTCMQTCASRRTKLPTESAPVGGQETKNPPSYTGGALEPGSDCHSRKDEGTWR